MSANFKISRAPSVASRGGKHFFGVLQDLRRDSSSLCRNATGHYDKVSNSVREYEVLQKDAKRRIRSDTISALKVMINKTKV